MRKINLLILLLSFAFLFLGCEFQHRPPPIHCEDVKSFSYTEDLAVYQEENSKIKRDGFVNTSELKESIKFDTEALQQAEKECFIEYSNYTYYYDTAAKMWKFEFWDIKDTEGNPSYIYQTVYLNDNGVTQLIVYCE